MGDLKGKLAAFLLAALSLVLFGCGGGGGGGAAGPEAPATYTLSGKTLLNGAGLAGVSVTFAGPSTATVASDAAGAFQGALPSGSYVITPSLAGYTFVPQSQTITVAGGNLTLPQDFTATATSSSFTVSGSVTAGGVGLAGVTVTIPGAGIPSVATDASGNYSFSGVRNGGYSVVPSLAGYSFAPLSQSITVNNGNVTAAPFTATATPSSSTFSISGRATLNGTGLAGVSITIFEGFVPIGTLTTDSTGNFVFLGVRNGSYTITPAVAGYSFTPASRVATVANGNLSLTDFTALPTNTGSITVQF